jgi:predicted aspartyl protease
MLFVGSVFLMLFLASHAVAAQPLQSPDEAAGRGVGIATDAPREETEALYASPTRRDRIGRIIAPVTINGQGPFRFVVDTGATHSALSMQLVQTLGLPVDVNEQIRVRGVTGSALVPTARIDRFEAGDLLIENGSMPVLASAWFGADGVLGMNGLEDKVIVVDFERDRIRILKTSQRWRNLSRVPVKIGFDSLLLADGYVGRVRVKAIIDTGAQHTLGNHALRQALQISDTRLPSYDVHGVTTGVQRAGVATAPLIRLGNMYLSRVNIGFGDMHVFDIWELADQPALLVGMDVLGVLEMIVIDYRRSELLFKPRSSGIAVRNR